MQTLLPLPFPELTEIEQTLAMLPSWAQVRTLTSVPCRGQTFPIHSILYAHPDLSADQDLPMITFVGGVHGLEKIGTQVILAYLQTFNAYLSWDESAMELLKKVRVGFIPMLNPSGIYLGRRSNANGVDLMRNSPVEADDPGMFWEIYRGHRISSRLPWYRGPQGSAMEREARALQQWVHDHHFKTSVSLSIDVHSGYGAVDRFWFPFAGSFNPFPQVEECSALKKLMDRTLPNHVYRFEPQCQEYTIHADLWDYFFLEFQKQAASTQVFIPFTLEMGSWNWIKKNPLQAFRALGIFHPIKRHRIQRVLRRHVALFDFLIRATASHHQWTQLSSTDRVSLREAALRQWYSGL